jgi:hypothetical protein
MPASPQSADVAVAPTRNRLRPLLTRLGDGLVAWLDAAGNRPTEEEAGAPCGAARAVRSAGYAALEVPTYRRRGLTIPGIDPPPQAGAASR